MVTDIFFVVLGSLAIVLSVFACALMFGYFRRQTQRCWQREQEMSQFGYLTERVAELRKQHEDLSRDLFYAEQTIEKADRVYEELQRLEAELQRLDDRRAELEHLTAELERLHADLADTAQRKLDLDQALQAGVTQRGELELAQRELVLAIAGLKKEEDDARSRVLQLEGQIQTLEQRRQEIEYRNDALTRRRDQLESTVQTLDQQHWQRLEEHNRAVGELTARREALSDEVEQLQKRVHDLQTERHDLEAAVDRRRAEHQILQQSVPHLQTENQELQRDRQRLQSEVSTLAHRESNLQERVNALRQQHTSLETTLREQQSITENVAELRVAERQLSTAVSHLQNEYERLVAQGGHASEEQRTADLWKPVFRPQDYEVSATPVDELGQLSALQSHLRRCRLRFHRRVLYAFHTALKVNDISPLVVLAGISGTGKSELPRRYAEAMGMHFLNLAVQPRWDSPQDMFGFFNYLDGRYRATELGRALIQMDPYYDQNGRGWNQPENWHEYSLRNQMLLVLLDEMNLARIEYYFSDFLSRLELRRGIDLNQALYREKAEIPLEVGRTGTTASLMRVFVDRNVFFVGTMNEDETTQSLSDKVVDRANVLRFGPPRRLALEPGLGHQEDGDSQPGTGRLAYDHWCRFLRDPRRNDALDTETRSQIHEWLHELNTAMRKIRRPFAYRVSRAMEAYIANYPLVDGEPRLDLALADQIEQKLLPKFRGLDPSEPAVRDALDTLRNLIPNDTALHNAIEDSIDADQHQFVWQGVHREEQDAEPGGFQAEGPQGP